MSEQPASRGDGPIRERAPRLYPLDALRGLIVVLMALDHANYFVAQKHSPGEYWGGPFPVYPDALAFVTRLVTHLCAPGFFFLMGAGMALFATSRRRDGWRERDIVWHFLVRGGLLIALQLLVVNRAWELSPGGWAPQIYIGVLFALGGAMMLASGLLRLRWEILLALSVLLLLGTELLTPDPALWTSAFSPSSRLLLIPGGDLALWVNYPVLPWLELVLFGLAFGYWLMDREQRAGGARRAFAQGLGLGVVLLSVFVVVRYLDGFGNIRPRAGESWIDFLNVVKYPPSITFTLLTLGMNLIILGLFAQAGERLLRILQPLVAFGREPLFFYVTHLLLYAGLGRVLAPEGTSLPAMYLVWLLGLLMLYPLCFWYGRFKHGQPPNSILRFF